MDSTELVHALAVFALFGLIWTIQLVHYPMFQFIEAPHWPRFHQLHSRNITFIVFPLMLVELLTSIQLLIEERSLNHLILGGCAAGVWLLTMTVFMPLHHKLSRGQVSTTLSLLVRFNWLRTFIWTLCCIVTMIDLFS